MDLGPQPFVTLEWGGYFFVPSIPALRNLPALAELPACGCAQPRAHQRAPLDDPAARQLWLEDQNTRDAAWAWVRAQAGGVVRTRTACLSARPRASASAAQQPRPLLRQRLRHAHGRVPRPRLPGHGRRRRPRRASPRHQRRYRADPRRPGLRRDLRPRHQWFARQRAAGQMLAAATGTPQTQLDLERLSLDVLAGLCTAWFGQPDGQHLWGTEYHPPSEAPHPAARPTCCPSRATSSAPSPPSAWSKPASAPARPTSRPSRPGSPPSPPRAPWAAPSLTPQRRCKAARPIQWPPPTPASCSASRPPCTPTCSPCWAPGSPRTSSGRSATVAGGPRPRHYAHAVARLRPAMLLTLNQRPTPFQVYRPPALTTASAPWTSRPATPSSRRSAPPPKPTRRSTTSPSAATGWTPRRTAACLPGVWDGMGVMLGVAAALLEAGDAQTDGVAGEFVFDV